jgi:hypothetical protein
LSNSSAIEAMCGAIDVILDAHSENTRTCTPVVVQSWTEPSTAGARCDVQLTIPNRAPDGSAIEPTPVVAERPVYYPAGGGWTIHYPLEAGDEVLGLCIDRNTEGWTTNRTPGAPSHALFERFHSESDMVVLAAADRPELPDATPDLDTDFVITHRTGGVVVRLGTDGKVTLTASDSVSLVIDPAGTIKAGNNLAEALVKVSKLESAMTALLNAGGAVPPTPMAGTNGAVAFQAAKAAWDIAIAAAPLDTTILLGT